MQRVRKLEKERNKSLRAIRTLVISKTPTVTHTFSQAAQLPLSTEGVRQALSTEAKGRSLSK